MASEVYVESRRLAKEALKDTESGIHSDILEIGLAGFLRDATVIARENFEARLRWMTAISKHLDRNPHWIHAWLRPGIYNPRRRKY